MGCVCIIGAGPAGLIAAERLAQAGHRVTVYDQMPSVGRKLLMAGRGGLNLTHSEPLDAFIASYGAAADWLAPVIQAFPPQDLRAWCHGLGQETFIGSSGRVFPVSMKASPLLRAWLQRLAQLGVTIQLRQFWQGWDGAALLFQNAAGQTQRVQADATLLALGGASWPKLGSDGGWFALLAAENMPLAPLQPANCGFIVPWTAHFAARFAGTPLKSISLSHAGETRQGEAVLTAQGLEGSLIYAYSARFRAAIAATGFAAIQLDLRPQTPLAALTEKLQAPRGSQSLSSYLRKAAGLSPLQIGLLREAVPTLTQLDTKQMTQTIKALPLRLTATAGLHRAISTAGGIQRAAIDENFMLRAKPGTFVAGEMLDWEAPTGGYLLQGCFSTGVAAAKGMTHWLARA